MNKPISKNYSQIFRRYKLNWMSFGTTGDQVLHELEVAYRTGIWLSKQNKDCGDLVASLTTGYAVSFESSPFVRENLLFDLLCRPIWLEEDLMSF